MVNKVHINKRNILDFSGMSLSEPLSSPSPRLKRNASMHSKPLHRICKFLSYHTFNFQELLPQNKSQLSEVPISISLTTCQARNKKGKGISLRSFVSLFSQ